MDLQLKGQAMDANKTKTVSRSDFEFTILDRATGVHVDLEFIGRCWRLYSPGGNILIAGGERDGRAIARQVAGWIRSGIMPIFDVHNVGPY